jgi:hypothetical protein
MRSTCLRWLPGAILLTVLAHPAAAGVDRWTPIGPEGGEILSLAADPDAPGTLYAGTRGGGVWKSLDGGGSWGPTPEGLGEATIYYLAVSAGRVYARTYYSMYLLTEGAASWRQVGPFFAAGPARELAVDPTDAATLYASSAYSGFWKTTDAGAHWSFTTEFGPSRLLALPGVLLGASSDLSRSEDGGGDLGEGCAPLGGYLPPHGRSHGFLRAPPPASCSGASTPELPGTRPCPSWT